MSKLITVLISISFFLFPSYLFSQEYINTQILEVDTASLTHLCMHPTKPLLFSASTNGNVTLWDLTNFQLNKTLKIHDSLLTDLRVDDQYIYSTSVDGKIKVTEYQTQKTLFNYSFFADSLSESTSSTPLFISPTPFDHTFFFGGAFSVLFQSHRLKDSIRSIDDLREEKTILRAASLNKSGTEYYYSADAQIKCRTLQKDSTLYTLSLARPNGIIEYLSPRTSGGIWIVTVNGDLYVLKNGVLSKERIEVNEYKIQSEIKELNDSTLLWISSNQSITLAEKKLNDKKITVRTNFPIHTSTVKCALEVDPKGMFWFHTDGSKIFYWEIYGRNFPLEKGKSVDLKIYFPIGEASITQSEISKLEVLFKFLHSNSSIRICLESYTDPIGNEVQNLHLSYKRAIEIKKYLVKRGIDPKRIETKGWGSKPPFSRSIFMTLL